MAVYEDDRLAVSARYLASSRELELTLDDDSRHLIPVDRLEMVKSTADAYVPIAKPTDEQLGDVKVWGGGTAVYWTPVRDTCKNAHIALKPLI